MNNILIVVNEPWNILNFRSNLIKKLILEKYAITILAPFDKSIMKLEKLGCKCKNISMDKKGTNPLLDIIYFLKVLIFIYKSKPDLILCYTIKPNIYASIASSILNISYINNITGLGATFIKNSLITKLVKFLYFIALKKSNKILFQNKDDLELFKKYNLVNIKVVKLIPGSGIDLNRFSINNKEFMNSNKIYDFLLVSRLLWDKGIGEFVAAAKIVKKKFSNINFYLLGSIDVENPSSISKKQIADWANEKYINYLGNVEDVRPFLASSKCIVLPSYREGTPRSLLEAGAMSVPIITTNVPGCKETVDDEKNGFLCKVKDPDDLADKMMRFINLSDNQRKLMGIYGRNKMTNNFDEKIVINIYLDIINQNIKIN